MQKCKSTRMQEPTNSQIHCINCKRVGLEATDHPANWTRCPERLRHIGNLRDKTKSRSKPKSAKPLPGNNSGPVTTSSNYINRYRPLADTTPSIENILQSAQQRHLNRITEETAQRALADIQKTLSKWIVRPPHPRPLSPTIKIIQLNCNKKGSTVHGLLNTCFNDADLLLLQEPWWAQISPNGTKGSVGHRAWTPILPTTTQSIDDPPPCIMAYFRPRPGMEVVLRSDLIQDRDIQILNIIHQGNPTTTTINLYNDHKRHDECATALLRTIPLSHNQPTIITGNWNMHHHLWSSSPNVNSSMETDCMVDWLTIHGYLLSNIPGQHTYIPYTSWGTLSVLDLIFANGLATQCTIPSDWTIKPEFVFDSDYLAIQWTLFNNVTPISNYCRNRYNIKDIDKNTWSTAFMEILEHFRGLLNVLIDTNNPISITSLKNAVSALSTVIICTNKQVAKKCNPSLTAKSWWNKTLTEIAAYIWQLWEL